MPRSWGTVILIIVCGAVSVLIYISMLCTYASTQSVDLRLSGIQFILQMSHHTTCCGVGVYINGQHWNLIIQVPPEPASSFKSESKRNPRPEAECKHYVGTQT